YIGLKPRLPRRLPIASIGAARPLHMTYRMAARIEVGVYRVLAVGGRRPPAPPHRPSRMAASIDVGMYRVLRLEAAPPPAAMVEALNRHQPEFLYAYGSVLGLLAAEQLDGRAGIQPGG